MTRRAAFTVIETLLAASLSALVVGAMVGLYTFVATRTFHAYARSNAVHQVNRVSDELARYISNAKECQTVGLGGTTALKCTMPAGGRDLNKDGDFDEYEPTSIKAYGMENFTSGKRVWFFFADQTGSPGTAATLIHKADRNDDASPTAADVDWAWEFYPGTNKQRYNLVVSTTYTIDATTCTTTFTVKASSLARADRQASASTPTNEKYEPIVTRSATWRNART